jgi:branched-chain amino acid transport system ATP-binding protein
MASPTPGMAAPILDVDTIGVRFGDFQALSGMSISVADRTIHSVIGPNGAGKTTLFNAVTGVRPPNSGAISFAGRVMTRTSAHARVHAGMARSFQVTNIYPALSVFENVRLAVQARHRREARVFWRSIATRRDLRQDTEEVLATVGIADRAATRAGDQRSLEIGMALAARPKLICLDEPLAGMGIDDVHRTKALILGLKERMAVLLIEHNMSVVLSISDRVTVMAQGKLIAEDGPDRIRTNETVRAAYLGSQA